MRLRAAFVLCLLTAALEAAGEEVLYYHNDATGNRVVMTDEAGDVVWEADVRPFGAGAPSPASRPLRFLGQEREPDTTAEGGLYMLGARYLDPFLGRFISPDPLPLDQVQRENPQRFNLYSYALNNPYRYQDATGFTPKPAEEAPGSAPKPAEGAPGSGPKPAEGPTGPAPEPAEGITINRENSIEIDGTWVKFEDEPLPKKKKTPFILPKPDPRLAAARAISNSAVARKLASVWSKLAKEVGGDKKFEVVSENSVTGKRM